jgi:hypothetical protein
MAQQNVIKKWDFVLVRLNGTHPDMPDEIETGTHTCHAIGINARLCMFNGSTRGQKFHEPRKQRTNVIGRVALCCFDC